MSDFTVSWKDETARRFGAQFTRGAMAQLGIYVLIVLAILLLIEASGLRNRDATDGPNGRSGMKLRTDHGTGCQYLETADGGITPRLGSDGRQMCR